MTALGDVLRALAPVLDKHTNGWFVFGAQAVAVRGAPRATQDLDVTVSLNRDALPALLDALGARGIAHRYPEHADEIVARAAVLPMLHVATGMEIDLVLAGSGLEALALSRADRLAVAHVEVPVVSATDLVVLKVLAGRGKDIDDARSVLASGDVDVEDARSLLEQLEEALSVSDLVPRLEGMLDRKE